MDIIICGHITSSTEAATGNTIGNFLRDQEISNYYSAIDDVTEFKRTRPNIQYRYFFSPSKPLASGLDLLKFDQEHIQPMI